MMEDKNCLVFRYKQFNEYNQFYYDKYANRFPGYIYKNKISFFTFEQAKFHEIAKCSTCLTDLSLNYFFSPSFETINCFASHLARLQCSVCYSEVGYSPSNTRIRFIYKFRLPQFLAEKTVTRTMKKRRFST